MRSTRKTLERAAILLPLSLLLLAPASPEPPAPLPPRALKLLLRVPAAQERALLRLAEPLLLERAQALGYPVLQSIVLDPPRCEAGVCTAIATAMVAP